MNIDFRCDLYVDNCIVVELKAISGFTDTHTSQLMNYMNLLKCPKGILINFNCINIFKDGQKTIVNENFRRLPEH